VVTGPLSGADSLTSCTATLDVLSSSDTMPLEIIAIDTGTLPNGTTISIDTFGEATATTGPRVTWQGFDTSAQTCTDLSPVEDITFLITATCPTDVTGETFIQEFTLSGIISS